MKSAVRKLSIRSLCQCLGKKWKGKAEIPNKKESYTQNTKLTFNLKAIPCTFWRMPVESDHLKRAPRGVLSLFLNLIFIATKASLDHIHYGSSLTEGTHLFLPTVSFPKEQEKVTSSSNPIFQKLEFHTIFMSINPTLFLNLQNKRGTISLNTGI